LLTSNWRSSFKIQIFDENWDIPYCRLQLAPENVIRPSMTVNLFDLAEQNCRPLNVSTSKFLREVLREVSSSKCKIAVCPACWSIYLNLQSRINTNIHKNKQMAFNVVIWATAKMSAVWYSHCLQIHTRSWYKAPSFNCMSWFIVNYFLFRKNTKWLWSADNCLRIFLGK
jgi:hypothetical protein